MKWFKGHPVTDGCCKNNSHEIGIDRKKYRYCSVCGNVRDAYNRVVPAETAAYVLSVVGGAWEIPSHIIFHPDCDRYREKNEYNAQECEFPVNWNGVIYPAGSWYVRRTWDGTTFMYSSCEFKNSFEKVAKGEQR